MTTKQYVDGSYLASQPSWHVEDSAWKAAHVLRMLGKHHISPTSVCEVGCGAGEILRVLQEQLPVACRFTGYDVSPQALELARSRANARLVFKQGSPVDTSDAFDLILLMDVIEHVEDYFALLRGVRDKAEYKVLHVPLDLSVQSVLRAKPIMRARTVVGHIHYFTKEIVLTALQDAGYDVIDHVYTGAAVDAPGLSFAQRAARLPRRALFRVSEDFAARILGGYSLLVLAR
jgi:2-polyprenyl-3-methyl-5-hydroxy-6-metoxy-1,4-benzoquinol methylase